MIAVAVAAAAMTSCSKEMQEVTEVTGTPINVTMQGPETKAVFGTPSGTTYPVLWQEGDEVKFMALKTPGEKVAVRVVEGHLARDIHSFRGTAEPPAVVVRQLLKDLLEFFIHLFQLLLLGEEKLDQKIFVQPFKLLFGKPGLHVPPPVSLYPLYRKWRF